jgi:hypothetical protein
VAHGCGRPGRCEGRKPYGFFEGDTKVLDRIKALRAEGLGFDRLAARSNEEVFRAVPANLGMGLWSIGF